VNTITGTGTGFYTSWDGTVKSAVTKERSTDTVLQVQDDLSRIRIWTFSTPDPDQHIFYDGQILS
jgi:hypothetical protein